MARFRYGRELCQTVFHCAKLIDLMYLPEIREVCRVTRVSYYSKVLQIADGVKTL